MVWDRFVLSTLRVYGVGGIPSTRAALLAVGLAFLALRPLAAETRANVRLWSEAGAAEIDGDVFLPGAESADVWAVLRDYDRLHAFIPNVDSSRVVRAAGDTTWVYLVGGARFVFRRTYRYVLAYGVPAGGSLAFRHVSGDLLGYEGRWSATPEAGGLTLRLRARLPYGLGAPWFLASGVVKRNLSRMLEGVAEEVARRASAEDP